MADFLENNAIAQNQGQQEQSPGLQQTQQYPNLGTIAQMSNVQASQSSLQAMQRQQGMQGGVMGNSIGNMTPHMAQILATRKAYDPAMLNRQLGLLYHARKQQQQNGATNFPQQGPSFNTGMFPPKADDVRAASQNQQQMPTSAGYTNQQHLQHALQQFVTKDGRNLTPDEIRMKALQLKTDIAAEKMQLARMPKNLPPEAAVIFRNKIAHIQQRELVYNRIAAAQAQMVANHQAAQASQSPVAPAMSDGHIQGQSNSLGFPNISQQQQQQQAGQQHMQPNPNWMSQMNNNGGLGNQMAGNGMVSAQVSNMPQQGVQIQTPHQQMSSPFHSSLVQSQQSTPVPRSGPTPQQQQHQQQMMQALFQQQNNQTFPQPTPNGLLLPDQARVGQQMSDLEAQEDQRPDHPRFPTLSRPKFMEMFKGWYGREGSQPDPRILQIEDQVIRMGGSVAVRRHELWPVIAAKMGLMQVNGSEQSRMQIANHIKLVHEQLLEAFELSVTQALMKQQMQPSSQQPMNQPGAQILQQSGITPTQQSLQILRMANTPVDVMRSQGWPEQFIMQVETHRPALQQQLYHIQMRQRIELLQQQQQQQQSPNQQQARMALQNSPSMQPQTAASNGLGQPGMASRTVRNPGQFATFPNLVRPSPEMIRSANFFITQQKEDVSRQRSVTHLDVRSVSEAERPTFNMAFDNLCRSIAELDKILPIYYALITDHESTKGIVSMIDLVERQRQLLQSPTPVFITDLQMVRQVQGAANEIRIRFAAALRQLQQQQEAMRARPTNMQPPPGDSGIMQQVGMQPCYAMNSMTGTVRPSAAHQQPPQLLPQNQAPPPRQLPPALPPSVIQAKPERMLTTSSNTAESTCM
ncbi:hypothetical protein DFH11DRAFT_1740967 [Phellopilus nigrolimitatus]|nr:hypothetical protein DFH11DRAFT_1740967 [Phellopilus nigrolimitatus]